jgi:hypothetical protein
METKEGLSILSCFKESISLTFSNFFAFLGAAVLAWICSVLSLSLMFPSLMTGLENMYLRAKAGEQVKATDIFIHRRKWWSLYWVSVGIAWHVAWFVFPLALVASVGKMLLIKLMVPTMHQNLFWITASFLIFLATCYRESLHLHALNLSAEFGLAGADSRHLSRLSIKSRWKDTVFTILLAVALVLFWIFDPILTPVGVLLLLPIMGATSMALLHDLGEKQEILELVRNYQEHRQRRLTEKAENPCPTCDNSNVRRSYIEDGGKGDWCPDCDMSLQKMRGLI